eukprot:6188292-Pleurochrysis_carterae.AAC.2
MPTDADLTRPRLAAPTRSESKRRFRQRHCEAHRAYLAYTRIQRWTVVQLESGTLENERVLAFLHSRACMRYGTSGMDRARTKYHSLPGRADRVVDTCVRHHRLIQVRNGRTVAMFPNKFEESMTMGNLVRNEFNAYAVRPCS